MMQKEYPFVSRVDIQLRMQSYTPMSGEKFYLKRLEAGDEIFEGQNRDGVNVRFLYSGYDFVEVGVTNPFQRGGVYRIFHIYAGTKELFNYIRQMVTDTAEALGCTIDAEVWHEFADDDTVDL